MDKFHSSPLYNVLMFSGCWALQIFAAKLGFTAGATVLPFQAALFLTAIITLIIILLPSTGRDIISLSKDNPSLFWKLFLANAVQSGLGTCLSIIGIALTDAINAGFLVKLATVTTILFAWLILGERMSWKKIMIIIAMLSGAYLLTTEGQTLYPQIGDIFIMGACVCWSLGNVFVRKVLKDQSVKPDVVTIQKPAAGFPVYLGFLLLAVSFPVREGKLAQVFVCCEFSPSYLPYALVSGICLAAAWIFLYRTLKVATASYMTLMSMLTPVIVSLLAIVFLGERFIWVQVLGGAMILVSGVAIYLTDIAQS